MITRAQMQRQLRNKGGVMTVKTIRKKYGLGSDFQDFKDKALGKVRDIIPNELADVAVKAAPIVAPFNPLAAAAMRGIGRFDQRGSISDALKQGVLTYAGGRGIRYLGGAEGARGGLDSFSMDKFREGPIGRLFKSDPTKTKNLDDTRKGVGIVQKATDATIGKIPLVNKLPDFIQQQLFIGTITSGATVLNEYFKGGFRPQKPGETMEDYLAARKEAVGGQMRTYMDNYFKFDKEYSTMTDAERDAFVARYNVRDGGRIGFANGGDIERFRKALYAANQVDEATGDRLYGNQINSLYAQYQNNPSGFFSEPEMYTRFNASFNAPATRPEDQDLLNLTGSGLLNQAAIGRSQQAARNEAALDMLNQSMAPTTQTTIPTGSIDVLGGTIVPSIQDPGSGKYDLINEDGVPTAISKDQVEMMLNSRGTTPSVVDISSAAATRPEDVDTTTLEEIMNQPLDAVPTNNPFENSLGAPVSEQRTSGITMRNTLRQNLLNNMEQRAANQRVLEAARARLPGAGIMNASSISNDPLRAPSDRIEEIRAQQLAAGVPPEGLINKTTGLPPQMNKGGRVGFQEGSKDNAAKINELVEKGMTMDEAIQKIAPGTKSSVEFTREELGLGPLKINQDIDRMLRKGVDIEIIKSMTGAPDELIQERIQVIRYSKAKGGLMSIPVRKNSEGIKELDMRKSGGFVPIGVKEKADDVPAMLSKNEFVMTADAVRAAGGGSINKGAQRMYDTMKKLESRVA